MAATDQKIRDPRATKVVIAFWCAAALLIVVSFAAFWVWSLSLEAPLEAPATADKAPNPAKAPWYFLGLQEMQEMQVYYDPLFVGIVLPTILGAGVVVMLYLCIRAIRSGSSPFTLPGLALTILLLLLFALWVAFWVGGTFLRGPNWNFFGPFEEWNPNKVLALNDINLSEIFWMRWLKMTTQEMPWYRRELPGLFVMVAYWVFLPPLLAMTLLRGFYNRIGLLPYSLVIYPVLVAAILPIKMVLRWTINLKYIVFIPEYFFNI